MKRPKKPRLAAGAAYLGNGPASTLFEWNGVMYRFAQNKRGGTIYRAHPCVAGLVAEQAMRRRRKRHE